MPTLDQLDAAMQDPDRFVPAIQQIGGGSITLTADGRPWKVVGQDAVVYRLTQDDGTPLALRCPYQDTFEATHADAYEALARGGIPLVPDLTDLLARTWTFKPEGVVVSGAELRSNAQALIVMEWIKGTTLLAAARECNGAADRETLLSLRAQWEEASQLLQDHDFRHGDLSATNVMVDQTGRIRVVDLDTCSWSGSPRPSMHQGTRGYMHPRAEATTSDANRDAFASLVISVSLLALAHTAGETTRSRGQPPSSGEELLFAHSDLAHLRRSAVFTRVKSAAPPELEDGLETLLRACEGSPNDVLSSVRRRETRGSRLAQPPGPPEELAGDARARVRQRDLERFRARWNRNRSGNASSESTPAAGEHGDDRNRQDVVQQLNAALTAGDDDRVAALWPGVRGHPALSARAIVIADIMQRRHGKRVAAALRDGNDQALLASVRDAEAAGVAIAASTRRAVRGARYRLRLRERTRAAIDADDSRTLAELTASLELEELLEDNPRFDIAVAARRAAQRNRLNRAVQLDDDAAIMEAWDPSLLANDPMLDATVRQRIDVSFRRRRWLDQTRVALRSRDVATLAESMTDAPEGAFTRLSVVEQRRISRLIERAAATAGLQTALETGPRGAILEAMNHLMASGATLPESLDWAKVRDVADREALVRAIREAVRRDPPDYERLALLLPAARSAAAESPFLDEDIDVRELERTLLREEYLRRLRAAMASSDDAVIAATAGPDPFGALATMTPEERVHIDSVLRRIGRHQFIPPDSG